MCRFNLHIKIFVHRVSNASFVKNKLFRLRECTKATYAHFYRLIKKFSKNWPDDYKGKFNNV